MKQGKTRIRVRETFGLEPLLPALAQCWTAIRGDDYLPPTRFGLSSVRIFKPKISLPLWLGRTRRDRRVPIYNLVNRNRDPAGAAGGYSVRVTDCRDYRGTQLTYDSHVGTDFAVPVGTEVVAAAPGVVRRVQNDMNRGGLKVCIEHGEGLFTTSNHLARALVRPGDVVRRGEVVGLSGMSGLDGVLFFPWLAPHLHFNVILAGEPVDPFAAPGEASLWRGGEPRPQPQASSGEEPFEKTAWDPDGVAAAVRACRDGKTRAKLESLDPHERAIELVMLRVFRGPLFDAFPPLTDGRYERKPYLDLPFKAEEYVGVCYP